MCIMYIEYLLNFELAAHAMAHQNPNVRYNFINDDVTGGTAVSCIKKFVSGDLIFSHWFKDSTRYQVNWFVECISISLMSSF